MQRILPRYIFFSLCWVLLLAFSIKSAKAQAEFDFGDEPNAEGNKNPQKMVEKWPLRGKINFETAYQTQDPRWIRMGPSTNLILDYHTSWGLFYSEATGRYNDSYRLEGDSAYITNNYAMEGVLRELYWKKDFASYTVTAGNVMTVWGKADILPVTDVLSPMDRTQAFFANPEETRLGQNTLKLDHFSQHSQISLLVVPYPVYDRITDADHPYSYTASASGSSSLSSYDATDLRLKDKTNKRSPEGGLRYNRIMGKGEAAVMVGWFNTHAPVFDIREDSLNFELLKEYGGYGFIGSAMNYAIDPLLLKFELAFSKQKPKQGMKNQTLCLDYNATLCQNFAIPTGVAKADELAFMFGFDHNMGQSGMILVEASWVSTLKRAAPINEEIYPKRDIISAGLGYSRNFFKDDLRFSSFVFFLESVNNILYRVQASYYVNDVFSLVIQYTGLNIQAYYQDYAAFADYDRLDIMMQYDFDLSR